MFGFNLNKNSSGRRQANGSAPTQQTQSARPASCAKELIASPSSNDKSPGGKTIVNIPTKNRFDVIQTDGDTDNVQIKEK